MSIKVGQLWEGFPEINPSETMQAEKDISNRSEDEVNSILW